MQRMKDKLRDWKEKFQSDQEDLPEIIHLDLTNPLKLSKIEQYYLGILLRPAQCDPKCIKISKNNTLKIQVEEKNIVIKLSHTIRRVGYDNKVRFEIVGKGEGEENVLEQKEAVGKLQKSHYAIEFIADMKKMKIYRWERIDKKLKQADNEKNENFENRVKEAHAISKLLYPLYEVSEPFIAGSRTKINKSRHYRLVSHISLPYFGATLDQVEISHLPIGNLMKLLVELATQLTKFHQQGLVYRCIKLANIAYDAKDAKLILLDPGLSMTENDDERNSQKNDVFAFGITMASILGIPENYLKDCCIDDEKINFNLITVDDKEVKAQLVAFLEKITRVDLDQIPFMEECLDDLVAIQNGIYKKALEKLEGSVTATELIIESDIEKRKSKDIKKQQFVSIQSKLGEFKKQLRTEKTLPDAENFGKLRKTMEAFEEEFEDELFKEPQGNWFKRNVVNSFYKCCCCLYFATPKSAGTARSAKRVLGEAARDPTIYYSGPRRHY